MHIYICAKNFSTKDANMTGLRENSFPITKLLLTTTKFNIQIIYIRVYIYKHIYVHIYIYIYMQIEAK